MIHMADLKLTRRCVRTLVWTLTICMPATELKMRVCACPQLPGYIHTQIAGEKHDDGHEIVMIPGIDMMNHGTGGDPSTATFEIKDGKATVTTGSGGLKRGEEVLVSYGDKICGVKPLNLYGFVWEACEGEPNHGGDPQPEEPSAEAADELPPVEDEGKKDL
jgi:hypothetical protein